MTIENKILENKKVCLINPNHETYIKKNGKKDWYKYKDGYICKKCYMKIFQHPKWNAVNKSKMIIFKGKQRILKKTPRTGYCSWCPNNTHNKTCKRTNIHHFEYDDNDLLKYTIEICASCHMKESMKLGQIK